MANETAVVDNPYGLQQLWVQGDFVAKGTMLILLIMSMMSWYVMITKAWDQRRLKKFAVAAEVVEVAVPFEFKDMPIQR